MSYAAIANKYGVQHDSVHQKLKYGAKAAGDPWPLKHDFSAKVRKGMANVTLPAAGIAWLIAERYQQESKPRSLTGTVYVPKVAIDRYVIKTKITWRRRHSRSNEYELGTRKIIVPKHRVLYHAAECKYLGPDFTDGEIIELDSEEALDWGYAECSGCVRGLTWTQWCEKYGLSISYVSKLMHPRPGAGDRIRYTQAAMIFRALGEPIPKQIRDWKPRRLTWDAHHYKDKSA